jgi:diguanylate cyclase (GGDEF)-like protein
LRIDCHLALAAWHRECGDLRAALAAMDQSNAVRDRVCRQESRDRLRAAELQRRASADGLIDHAEVSAAALAKAYAELETLNASLRAADTAKTELLARLERRTFEDALTGLHNRRYAELRMAEEFQRAIRHQRPLSVSLIDIDDFRRINEHVSHAVADRVLKTIGELVVGSVRTIDIVARYGSDEFLVIFPDTTEEGASHAIGNVRDAIAGHDWQAIGVAAIPGVTVATVGVAGLATHERMLAAAERRLEVIKRNRAASKRRIPG